MVKTGIFGGSFNPIHNGHLSLALQLRQRAGLDEVWMMVSPQNPLKRSSGLLDDTERLEMVRRAVDGIEGLTASDYEMHLPKPSYTWHTLQALSHDYPQREFVLLMGGDNWALFRQWYRHEDILRNYRIIVYPRRNGSVPGTVTGGGTGAESMPLALLDISSTDIRERIRSGGDIRGMVPEAVASYIREKGFYR